MNNFRKIQPPVFPVTRIKIPDIASFTLNNGVPVYHIEAGTEDIMRVEFSFKAGIIKETVPLVASSTNLMLTEGSANYSSEELNRLIDFYGAFVNMYYEKDRAGIVVFFLSKHIEKILELCHEMIILPIFHENELNALLQKRLQWFRVNREKVQNLSMDKFFEVIFGRAHKYGYQVVEEDFEGINPQLLKDFHAQYYSPGNMAVFVSGKIHERTNELFNKFFGGKISGSPTNNSTSAALVGEKEKKFHLEKSGAVQSSLRIGSPTINKRHPDYHGFKILDTILGGYFGSRLMKNIREDKGYTYGISSIVTSLDLSGYKIISTEVAPKNLNETVDEIFNEVRRLQIEPPGEDELNVVRNYMSGELVRMFDGPFALAESFKSAWEFGLDTSYYQRLSEKILTIKPEEITDLANKFYKLDELYVITAGD